ncbi:nuclear transport factor 2 family protein [Rhodococcus indonesiensis]|uniref:nuclear transport factor 2 family protein n=1 Tax=Rhodococcus indonesiensis TaxID=3055869 RepID=UPI0039F6854B
MQNTAKGTRVTEYEQGYTPEQKQLAEHIIGLEKAALDKWFAGDVSGYRELWSRRSFTYFDGTNTERVENHDTVDKFLDELDGKLHADTYEFRSPRVQFGTDMALLTYQLFADTNLIDMKYNCIELYQREDDSQWRVVHSTWSFIRPMDMDFGSVETVV